MRTWYKKYLRFNALHLIKMIIDALRYSEFSDVYKNKIPQKCNDFHNKFADLYSTLLITPLEFIIPLTDVGKFRKTNGILKMTQLTN